jgi:hypothetical protein
MKDIMAEIAVYARHHQAHIWDWTTPTSQLETILLENSITQSSNTLYRGKNAPTPP